MKKLGFLLIVLLGFSLFSFVIGQDDMPSSGTAGEDMEAIQGAIDESGGVDEEKIEGFKSKAEERIEKINEYVGPVSNFLFGVELSLSWIFVFSVLMWILLIELLVVPASEFFEFNVLACLGIAAILSTLAMRSFGKDFVIWIDSLMTSWWIGLVAIFVTLIVGVVYSMFMRTAGKKYKETKEKYAKHQTKQDRQVIHTEAEVSKERLESYKAKKK